MLNPISGETRATYDPPLIDPVTGRSIPLICSNFDAHHVYDMLRPRSLPRDSARRLGTGAKA